MGAEVGRCGGTQSLGAVFPWAAPILTVATALRGYSSLKAVMRRPGAVPRMPRGRAGQGSSPGIGSHSCLHMHDCLTLLHRAVFCPQLLKQSKGAKLGSVNQLTARGKLPNVQPVFVGAGKLYDWWVRLKVIAVLTHQQ